MSKSRAFHDDNSRPVEQERQPGNASEERTEQGGSALAEVQRRCAELERINARLRREVETKAQLLAQLSHEIRTPLNAIGGFAELLADGSYGPLTEDQQRFVAHIREAGAHLLQLLNDVIDLARFDTGKMELDLQPVAVAPVAEQAARVLGGLAREKGVTIRLQPQESDLVALADEHRARQVLFNLLSNAIKYSPKGLDVEMTLRRDGEHVRVEVRDQGPGIAPEDQERIFKEFVRLDDADDDAGAGLGLALSRQLVHAHGCEIGVDSAPGQGSTFWFTLPLARRPDDDSVPDCYMEGACSWR